MPDTTGHEVMAWDLQCSCQCPNHCNLPTKMQFQVQGLIGLSVFRICHELVGLMLVSSLPWHFHSFGACAFGVCPLYFCGEC